jgi:hypothetical protein
MGGWLKVRTEFLYSRTSAGMIETDEDLHLGQIMGST